MLRLDLSPEPRWIDLLPGVRVLVRPMSSAVWLIARAEVGMEAPADADRAAAWAIEVQKSVARRLIADWSGVGDLDGTPIPPSPEAVSALLDRRDASEAFDRLVFGPWYLADAEKNVSAPSSGGNSAGAETTAGPAAGSAPTARAGSTPPGPRKAG